LIEALDLVKAGGSRMTTSNFSPFFSRSGRSSNTSAHSKLATFSRPFSAAFSLAYSQPRSDASTPKTDAAPPAAALSANEPVCVKQSRTFLPLQSPLIDCLLNFWSRKKPVFWPFSKSTV
jgi:hypothetical protein